jgi:catechol 1,2-dioxygenase
MLTMIVAIIAIVATTIHAQQACQLTDPDILGPYYIPGAPKAEDQLCANLPAHDRVILSGRVVDFDSKCAKGLPYAKLDLWQANYNGVYSTGKGATDWFCRGVFQTDANGNFRITTLMPGRYDDGGYRPAHIHFNVTAEGYPSLVTQLYFNLDYYLSPRDSCTRCRSDAKSLILSTVHRDDIKTFEGSWTIAISKTPRIHFPPMTRKTLKRGSYIDIKEHIMH